ncbi:MAG: GNAT family N-acetyltransferase [Stappiaceae bacterium]
MSTIETKIVGQDAAHHLAPLIAAYAQELNRGAPRRPDQYYAERLLQDGAAEVLGGYLDGKLVGFCLYFDLPETITGMRTGQLDDIFVLEHARGNGVAQKMLQTLVSEGEKRGWIDLRWIVPAQNNAANALYERFAKPANFKSYVIQIDKLIRRG